MSYYGYISTLRQLAWYRKSKLLLLVLSTLFITTAYNNVLADFQTYNGDSTVELEWQTAVGNTILEDFESYSDGTQISTLSALGIDFDVLTGGGFPDAYLFSGGTPHGPMHLSNFPNGINEINRWDDIVLRIIPGYKITALGFWNGDGQRDTLVATAYDADGNVLGSVGAFKGTFAGFISDVAVSRIVFEGNTGDGWNHLDGLQTNPVNMDKPQISVRGGFVKLDVTGGALPSSVDCTVADRHYGRMIVDELNNILYICTASGWKSFN